MHSGLELRLQGPGTLRFVGFTLCFIFRGPRSSRKSPALKVAAADAAERLGRVVRPVCQSVIAKDFEMFAEQRELTGRGPPADLLDSNCLYFLDTLAARGKDVDEMTWIVRIHSCHSCGHSSSRLCPDAGPLPLLSFQGPLASHSRAGSI